VFYIGSSKINGLKDKKDDDDESSEALFQQCFLCLE